MLTICCAADIRAAETPKLSFALPNQMVKEESGTVSVMLNLSAASESNVIVPYILSGTAKGNGVNHDLSDGKVVITAGKTTAIIAFNVIDNHIHEGDLSVVIQLGKPENADLGDITVHTVTIKDNDDLPTVTWTSSDTQVPQNIGTVTVWAKLNTISGLDVNIPYTVGGTAAGDGADHDLTAGILTIAAGKTTGSLSFKITDHNSSGSDKTVIITMGTPVNAAKGAISVHTVIIRAVAVTPSVSWISAIQTVSENIDTVTVTAVLSAVSLMPVTVPYKLSGTAAAAQDYEAPDGKIIIQPGQTSGFAIFKVIDDPYYESDETIIFTMDTPENATKGQISVHTVTIIDNDVKPVIQWTSSRQTVAENVGQVTLTASMTHASLQAIVVPYTVSGTTVFDADHDLADGSITFQPGETSASLSFNIKDDAVREQDETLIITLKAIATADLGNITAYTLTITDNDADHILPTITLKGDNPATVLLGEKFQDPGAIASDNVEGDISARIVVSSNVNTKVEGSYRITYSVSDESGNPASEAVRIVHVTKVLEMYAVTAIAPTGIVLDNTSQPLENVLVSSDVSPYTTLTGADGSFIYTPLYKTGRIYYLTFSKAGYVSTSREFSDTEKVGNVVLVYAEDSDGFDMITGRCLSYKGDPVSNAAIQLNSSDYPAIAFSDINGWYRIAVDRRAKPYTFSVSKYAYQSKTFKVESVSAAIDITLIPETRLTIVRPDTSKAYQTAQKDNLVKITITATPPFTGNRNELIFDKSVNTVFASESYTVSHAPYESFRLQISADTTEDGNAGVGYAAVTHIVFPSMPDTAQIVSSANTLDVTPGYPMILLSSDETSASRILIPPDGLQGRIIPDKLRLSMTEYDGTKSQILIGKIVEISVTDEYGKTVGGYPLDADKPLKKLFIRMEYTEPLSKEKLKSGADMIVWAETVPDLMENSTSTIPADNIVYLDEDAVTFRTDRIGAFGLKSEQGPLIEQGLTSEGGGGCFIHTLINEK